MSESEIRLSVVGGPWIKDDVRMMKEMMTPVISASAGREPGELPLPQYTGVATTKARFSTPLFTGAILRALHERRAHSNMSSFLDGETNDLQSEASDSPLAAPLDSPFAPEDPLAEVPSTGEAVADNTPSSSGRRSKRTVGGHRL